MHAAGRILTNFLVDALRRLGTLHRVSWSTTRRSSLDAFTAAAGYVSARVPSRLALIAVLLVVLLIGPAGTGTL